MNKIFSFPKLVMVCLALMICSCKDDFLDRPPYGTFSEEGLSTREGVDGILTGAYASLLGNIGSTFNTPSQWLFGSVMSDDAYKGSEPGDNAYMTVYERYEHSPETNGVNWRMTYVFAGVARCNDVLRVLKKSPGVPATEARSIEGQARAIRGYLNFQGTVFFGRLPWLDENTENFFVPNERLLWPEIEADLKFAYDNLPATYPAVGRINKWAAGALYGKALLYQNKYAEAKAVFDDLIANGTTSSGLKYGLNASFHDNFRTATNNSQESVLAAQNSVNDNGNGENSARGDILNFPHGGEERPGGCCGFFQPSQNLVNAFKTNPATGLPLLDDFNQADVKNDQGLSSADPFIPYEGTVDPRLDWTVGRRGIPYLDWGPHPGRSWIRDQNFGGPYSPKKNVYYRAEEGTLTHVGYWAKGLVAINGNIIRFADVLLMAAECEIELGNLETARGYVNQIRRRAANTAGFVKNPDGSPAANYLIQEYTEPWADPENARKAVRFERRLELAMEGHRFYDLVRWGIAEKTLNEYLTVEGTKRPYLQGAVYRPHNAIFPIPQSHLDVINRDNTVFVQNPGY